MRLTDPLRSEGTLPLTWHMAETDPGQEAQGRLVGAELTHSAEAQAPGAGC